MNVVKPTDRVKSLKTLCSKIVASQLEQQPREKLSTLEDCPKLKKQIRKALQQLMPPLSMTVTDLQSYSTCIPFGRFPPYCIPTQSYVAALSSKAGYSAHESLDIYRKDGVLTGSISLELCTPTVGIAQYQDTVILPLNSCSKHRIYDLSAQRCIGNLNFGLSASIQFCKDPAPDNDQTLIIVNRTNPYNPLDPGEIIEIYSLETQEL